MKNNPTRFSSEKNDINLSIGMVSGPYRNDHETAKQPVKLEVLYVPSKFSWRLLFDEPFRWNGYSRTFVPVRVRHVGGTIKRKFSQLKNDSIAKRTGEGSPVI